MESKLSTYVEFPDQSTAEQAVRALKAAGFDHIEIEDLSHGMQTATDNSDAPARKIWKYSVVGFTLGAVFGCAWGLIVFGLPMWVLEVPFGGVLAMVGLIICISVGAIIGLEQAYVLVGRLSADPSSVLTGSPVGVRVHEDSSSRLLRAREILNLFIEVSARERRWWQLRRWAHNIGT